MSAAGYLALLEKLADLDAPSDAMDAFRKIVLDQLAAEQPEQRQRIDFARGLLTAGEARPIVRDRLCRRFDIKKSQAYRDIDAALKIVPTVWEIDQV